MDLLLLFVGFALLTGGAEVLVRSASTLALVVGISPLVVGLTVVAFGTSAPELVVSVQAALQGEPALALGNVVGSNIFNVLFILGLSALIVPLVVSQQLVRLEVPLMIGLSFLVFILSLDHRLGRIDGGLFCVGMLAYTVWSIRASRREQRATQLEYEAEFGLRPRGMGRGRIVLQVALLLLGLALLVVGSRLLTESALNIARRMGVSEFVIGLTLVAAGTSLPEVATSVMAAIRGERDIAVGNALGSNLFNIMGVLGITALVAPDGIPVADAALRFDIPVMIAVAVACLPIFFTGHLIARWEGGLFLAYFVAYMTYVALSAMNHELQRTLTILVGGFALPLTVVTLAVGTVRFAREKRLQREGKVPQGDRRSPA